MSFKAMVAVDLAYALSQCGVPVTLAGATTPGLLEFAPDEVLEADGVAAVNEKTVRVLVQTGTLPGLAAGALLTADGTSYRVHRHAPIEDGAVTSIIAVPA